MSRVFSLAAVTVILSLVACSRAEPATAQAIQAPDLLGARTKGSPTAPVRVVEMSDFQCPWCRRFATETFAALEREYIATGKVRWVFLNFPISELHPNAVAAAEMAMCSAAQGKFWPMHDLLFAHQETWAPLREPGRYLLTLADSLRIPRDSIVPCLQGGGTRDLVQRDANTAHRIGARSTPTFLVDQMLMSGAYPIEVFRQVLDSIYAAKTASR